VTMLFKRDLSNETAAAALSDRGGTSGPERLRGGGRLAYLATRGLETDPLARGRARHPGFRAPRQAPRRRHRARQSRGGHRRADSFGSTELAAGRRGVRE